VSTKFQDGPAKGATLTLRSAPQFLRVTVGPGGKLDALDQPGDEPEPDEGAYAYRKVSDDGGGFLDYTDRATGRRKGMAFRSATYALADPQPPDEALYDAAGWRAWCAAQEANR
jgi:hypothetical protein